MKFCESIAVGYYFDPFQELTRQMSCWIPVVALPSLFCHVTTPYLAFRRHVLLPATRHPRPDWQEAEGQRRAWGGLKGCAIPSQIKKPMRADRNSVKPHRLTH